jgi:hypothetical protein
MPEPEQSPLETRIEDLEEEIKQYKNQLNVLKGDLRLIIGITPMVNQQIRVMSQQMPGPTRPQELIDRCKEFVDRYDIGDQSRT